MWEGGKAKAKVYTVKKINNKSLERDFTKNVGM